jgi:two-component sensor histidine kinase
MHQLRYPKEAGILVAMASISRGSLERLFLLTARSRGMPIWARYGATTLLVLACLGLRWSLFGPEARLPFLLFFPAIILAGLVFDRGTGIYASLLSALLAVWLFIEPTGLVRVAGTTDLLALLVFLGIALFTAFLLEALHVALRSLGEERASLATANAELAASAQQKGTLLSEAVHRARNDLQRLAATLHLQAGVAEEPAARQALNEASDRITALARINTRLDRHRDDGQPEVDIRGFLEGMVDDLRDGVVGLRPIALVVSAEAHAMPMARAVPIGLIVNELIGNALKYAFPDDQEGRLEVGFQRVGGEFILTVEDNGVGYDPAATPQGSGLGSRISRALAGQLGGSLTAAPAAPAINRPGVRWTMRFPAIGSR